MPHFSLCSCVEEDLHGHPTYMSLFSYNHNQVSTVGGNGVRCHMHKILLTQVKQNRQTI